MSDTRKRLTFEGNFCDIAQCASTPGGSFCENGTCSQRNVWERLKEYEDAEEQGRLLITPCAVGDYVYDIWDGTAYKTRVTSFTMFSDHAACRTISGYPDLDQFGTRIFLTREEAEAALEKALEKAVAEL